MEDLASSLLSEPSSSGVIDEAVNVDVEDVCLFLYETSFLFWQYCSKLVMYSHVTLAGARCGEYLFQVLYVTTVHFLELNLAHLII